MKPILSISNLSRRFGDFPAVEQVSFALNPGDVLGFLGPNGAGKSTTMRMISGGLAPSSGSVEINGIDLHELPLKAKAHIGYLPENPPLYPELTVDEYLRYAAELRHLSGDEIASAVASVKGQCGLTDSGHRLIANLSKGYQQRVGIAQAIIHSPDVVILDEPTNGLDPNQMQEIRTLIRELGKTRGIILCTHILPEVQTVCNRVLILHQGRVAFSAAMSQFRAEQHEHLILGLNNPPDISALEALNTVVQVERLDDHRFRLKTAPNTAADDIAAEAIRQGWSLNELRWENEDLEQIFTRLTTAEVAS